MSYHHNQEVHTERLRTQGEEHLNLAVILAQSIRQMADRARAMGSLLRMDAQSEDAVSAELSRLLAGDPVFNRVTIYDGDGQLLYASAAPLFQQLPALWLQYYNMAGDQVIVPPRLSPGDAPDFSHYWRLPFLMPLGQGSQIMLIELDVGYLLSLYQHTELGETGFIQLLDQRGREYLRVDAAGVVIEGERLLPVPPADQTEGVYLS